MPLFSWLQKRMTGRPYTRRTPAPRFRPQLETLEARDVPSTLTVTNNLDSGVGSLRAEIAAAKAMDTIVFALSLDGQTIKLTSGELDITHSLTIQGPGAGQLTVSGGNASRVFEVDGAATNVTLSGLTITGGTGVAATEDHLGGGILNDGSTMTVSGCTLTGNTGAADGGGVFNSFGTVSIVNSTLSGNYAGYGGGVYNNHGTVTISNSTLSANTATYDGGGVCNSAGTVTVSNGTLSGNTAGTYGGGLYNTLGTVTLLGSTLSANSASGGGGIYTLGGRGALVTISDCIFSANRLEDIWNASSSAMVLTISDSVFSANLTGNIHGPWTNGGGNTFS